MANILSIVPYAISPAITGGQKGIFGFTEFLSKKHNVLVASVKANALSTVLRIEKVFSDSRLRYCNPFLYFKLLELARRYATNVIIVEHPYMAWLAYAVSCRLKIPFTLHTHNIESERFRSIGKCWWWLLRCYERWAMRRAAQVLFVTNEDRHWAIENFGLSDTKCVVVPYGIYNNVEPVDRPLCRKQVLQRHGIEEDTNLFLFFGVLSYRPNLEAVDAIVDELYKRLLQTGMKFKVLLCGKGLPEVYRQKLQNYEHVLHVGFVEDIEEYVKASDVMLNPVLTGGGIKTKIVEAIALGTTVVSTLAGAAGVSPEICGEKLLVSPNEDWDDFVQKAQQACAVAHHTPPTFYDNFYWGSVVERVRF